RRTAWRKRPPHLESSVEAAAPQTLAEPLDAALEPRLPDGEAHDPCPGRHARSAYGVGRSRVAVNRHGCLAASAVHVRYVSSPRSAATSTSMTSSPTAKAILQRRASRRSADTRRRSSTPVPPVRRRTPRSPALTADASQVP